MSSLFDSPDAADMYLVALNLVDDLRNEIYALQDAGQPVEGLIDKIFDIEEELLRYAE